MLPGATAAGSSSWPTVRLTWFLPRWLPELTFLSLLPALHELSSAFLILHLLPVAQTTWTKIPQSITVYCITKIPVSWDMIQGNWVSNSDCPHFEGPLHCPAVHGLMIKALQSFTMWWTTHPTRSITTHKTQIFSNTAAATSNLLSINFRHILQQCNCYCVGREWLHPTVYNTYSGCILLCTTTTVKCRQLINNDRTTVHHHHHHHGQNLMSLK